MNCSYLVLVYKPSLKPKLIFCSSSVSDAIRKADVNLLFATAFFLFVCFRFKYRLPVRDLCGYVRYCTHKIYKAGLKLLFTRTRRESLLLAFISREFHSRVDCC